MSSTLLKLPIIYFLLEGPTHNKNLPKCTAGYETSTMHNASRITGATFFEIAVYQTLETVFSHNPKHLEVRQK